MKRSRRGWQLDAPEQEYWMSYSDLMAGLIMVFALMLFSALYFYGKRLNEVSSVVAVRDDLVETLTEIIGKVDSTITIDPATGNVRFVGEVLFDEGSAELRPEGEETLRLFTTQILLPMLREPKYTQHIETIVVEGHTNDNGTYLYNLGLSQERAYAVMHFILSSASETTDQQPNTDDLHLLQRFLTANGRSYSTPICIYPTAARSYNECESIDKERSRRIEIRFRLKTDEALRQVRRIVQGDGTS